MTPTRAWRRRETRSQDEPHGIRPARDEPWIAVRIGDQVHEPSLREVFQRAGEIRGLAGEIPTQDAAILRCCSSSSTERSRSIATARRSGPLVAARGTPLAEIDAHPTPRASDLTCCHRRRLFQVAGLSEQDLRSGQTHRRSACAESNTSRPGPADRSRACRMPRRHAGSSTASNSTSPGSRPEPSATPRQGGRGIPSGPASPAAAGWSSWRAAICARRFLLNLVLPLP